MKKTTVAKNKLKRMQEKAPITSLTLFLSAFVFGIFAIAISFTAICVWVLNQAGVLVDVEIRSIILFMSLNSLLIGGVMAFFSCRIPLKPIHQLIYKMNCLAKGEYHTRLSFGPSLSANPTFAEITESFNTMAEELENTEMLRMDFINNFSHEFKTPIVSITGLAKLMAKGNVTEEERMQYLHAIEEESSRLSAMATNVLRLTSVENQAILKDVTSFNLSEQVRSAVLLLEPKWSRKNLNIALDFLEYTVEANEELLMEVWINLLDNAIKFSPEGGTLSLALTESEHSLCVAIGNEGITIPKEKQERIFQKFYQADESHATMGNGIGLAIVKRIVDLHKGQISLVSEDGYTEFRITLHK